MHLLLLEDDPRLRKLVAAGLRESGHGVEECQDAAQALNLARSVPFDALILDVMLGAEGEAGIELARTLRRESVSAPILFLTARADIESRLCGLEAGGDDYLTKPFDFRELRARLAALVRRSVGRTTNALPLPGGGRLDVLARTVTDAAGAVVALTPREYELLEGFALRPERAYSRGELLLRVWSGQPETDRVVDVYVANLRRKLGEGVIQTVRGHGYRLGSPE